MDILEKAANDEALGLADQGALLHFFFKGPQKKSGLPVMLALHINELIQGRYLEADSEYYFMGPDEADLNDIWAAFYKAYPGVKTGANVDYAFFKNKYAKGKWKVVLRELPGHLQRQIEQRKDMEAAILIQETHGNKHHRMFLPSWKNLRTYLGNRQGWLENYIVPEQYASKAGPRIGAEHGNEDMPPDYRKYYCWAGIEGLNFVGNSDVVRTQILAEKEFFDIVDGKVAPFKDYELHCTLHQLKVHVREWQIKYFGEVYLRQKHARFWDYCCSEFRREYKSQ